MADLLFSFFLWLWTVLLDLLYPDFGCDQMENLAINQQQQQQQLPVELVTEILSRLPVPCLLKFKTVCKSWYEIISSPSFAESSHLDNYCNNNDSCIFLHTFDSTTQNWKLSMVFPDGHRPAEEFPLDADFGLRIIVDGSWDSKSNIEIAGPVNGLICFYGLGLNDGITLCNPCIRKTETLSSSPSTISSSGDEVMINERLFRCAGLGFDPARRDVKVVQVLSYIDDINEGVSDIPMFVDIYSRNTDTWKNLEGGVPNDIWVVEPITAPNNGSFCQWVATRGMSYVVLSLDLRDEVFECTPLPHIVSDVRQTGIKIFGGSGNSLVLFSWALRGRYPTEGGKLMDIWELSGLGEEGHWTRLPGVIGPLLHKSMPVGLWKTHELVLKYVKERRFVVYDCYTREVRNIDNSEDWDQCNPKVVEYKGSLVSPALFRIKD